MVELIKVLWNILLRKSDQMALPNSMFLLFVVFLFYFLSQSVSGFTVSETPLVLIRSFFVDAILMIVFIRLGNAKPAAFAALGNRLVEVIPGRVFISRK